MKNKKLLLPIIVIVAAVIASVAFSCVSGIVYLLCVCSALLFLYLCVEPDFAKAVWLFSLSAR